MGNNPSGLYSEKEPPPNKNNPKVNKLEIESEKKAEDYLEIKFDDAILKTPTTLYNVIDEALTNWLTEHQNEKSKTNLSDNLKFLQLFLGVFKNACQDKLDRPYIDHMLFFQEIVALIATNTEANYFKQLKKFLSEKLIPDQESYTSLKNTLSEKEKYHDYYFLINPYTIHLTKLNLNQPIVKPLVNLFKTLMEQDLLYDFKDCKKAFDFYSDKKSEDFSCALLQLFQLGTSKGYEHGNSQRLEKALNEYFDDSIKYQPWAMKLFATEHYQPPNISEKDDKNDNDQVPDFQIQENYNTVKEYRENNPPPQDLNNLIRENKIEELNPSDSQIEENIINDIENNTNIVQEKYSNTKEDNSQPNKHLFFAQKVEVAKEKPLTYNDRYQKLADWYDENKKEHETSLADFNQNLEKFSQNYTCPISLSIFEEPVMIESGFTYERAAIEEWFLKNKTCPESKSTIEDTKLLVPNKKFKSNLDSELDILEKQKVQLESKINPEITKPIFKNY